MRAILFICGVLLFASCGDDTPKNEYPQPTPFELRVPVGFPLPVIPADNALTVEGIDLGRHLFFDKKLSADGTQSCGSCHNQQMAFTDNNKRFSTGITGAIGTRNAMAIFNLTWVPGGFFWDGRANTLREQALIPIEDPIEMAHDINLLVSQLNNEEFYKEKFGKAFGTEEVDRDKVAKALEQFMLSIISVDSKFDKARRGEAALTPQENEGFDIFMREFRSIDDPRPKGGDCFHCHGGQLFTTNTFHNNGISAEPFADEGRFRVTGLPSDKGKFRAPSLRNIAVSGPYMHDGRFETLIDVLNHYNNGVIRSSTLDPNMKAVDDGLGLTPNQVNSLLAFLNSLTDTVYLNNPAYKNPFE